MAMITRLVRWKDKVPMSNGLNASTDDDDGIRVYGSEGPRLITGLKMDVSPGLLSSSMESKLFAVIPQGLATVRELKNHLAVKVFKTHLPFYFYNGDYRILDDEDIRVFALLSEPCRVVPVPQPKSALSNSSINVSNQLLATSTPLSKPSGSGIGRDSDSRILFEENNFTNPPSRKRVKFSDEFQYSAMEMELGNTNLNQPTSTPETPDEVDSARIGNNNNVVENLSASSSSASKTTKRQKRRRHRKHKDKIQLKDFVMEDNVKNGDESITDTKKNKTKETSSDVDSVSGSKPATPLGYDADESEIELSQNRRRNRGQVASPRSGSIEEENGSSNNRIPLSDVPVPKDPTTASTNGDSEFLSPNTVFSGTVYRSLRAHGNGRKRISAVNETQTSLNSSSGYESSHFASPTSTDVEMKGHQGDKNGGGKRKDTPMLPRILKNPSATYEMVKKSLNFNGTYSEETELEEKSSPCVKDTTKNGKSPESETLNSTMENELKTIEDVSVGNILSFQMLELMQDCTPGISLPKLAEVIVKEGQFLSLNYIDNPSSRNLNNGESESMEDNETLLVINFADLINPMKK